MTVSFWRIATDTRDCEADDLSGAGARKTGGRWNEVGVAMVYAASTRALACLETIVHLNAGGLPLNRYLVEIALPDELWTAAEHAMPETIVGWDAEPPGRASIAFGTQWVKSRRSAVLVVPSVIVPEENNLLINPAHAGAAQVTSRQMRKWLYDPRMARSA